MGWTSKMSANRFPYSISKSGNYRSGSKANVLNPTEKTVSNDTQIRNNILNEIKKRCEKGENLDSIVTEIAGREKVKQQFDYYIKNGITDLSGIFKNWYQSHMKNQGRDKFYPGGIR